MTAAQQAALAVYFDAGHDYGKQMMACISIRWHRQIAAALESKKMLERHDPPYSGMFRITPLGRFYAISNSLNTPTPKEKRNDI